jgi:signal transduction histidine kinase
MSNSVMEKTTALTGAATESVALALDAVRPPLPNAAADLIAPALNPSNVAALEKRVGELEAVLEHRERQIDAMRRTGDTLFTTRSLDELVRQTLEIAIRVLNADAGSLLLHRSKDDTLVFRYVVGAAADSLSGFAMPSAQGIAGRVFHSGRPDLTQKVSDRAEFNRSVDEKTGYRTDSMLTVPVKRAESRPIGVMQVLNARALFDQSDLEVLEVLSAVAAAAFENARLSQEARKAAIVNLIGDISHDIKNMLTPIQSGVWTLEPMLDELFTALDEIRDACPESEPLAAKIEQAALSARDDYKWILAGALDAAEKVQARTKEIADAVKGETAAPQFEEADLNEVAREVARSLSIVAHDAKLNLCLDLDAELPLAWFDRKQMYNALYNLVNNAIPETPPGGSITVRTRSLQAEGVLLVEVEDTGKGIPEKVRARLFSDDAISTKPGGTGLGTRIVAGVVQRHNGHIEALSEEGQGALFRIRLPLRQP